MDPLSEILKSVRLDGAVYLDAEFTAPWCVQASYEPQGVERRLAGAEHVVYFHFLTEGTCKMRLAQAPEVFQVAAGDLILFPHDDRHLLGSDLHLTPLEATTLLDAQEHPVSDLLEIRHGGGGAATRFVCGYLSCSRSVYRMLFVNLPRALCIPIGDGSAAPLVRELLRVGVDESLASRPGASSLLAKLAELIFVEAMRRHSQRATPQRGWLAALQDPQVGRVLALLHSEPRKAWTVDVLASQVGLSRSILASRFAALVGEPPMQYLTRWRLTLAAQELRSGAQSIARLGESSGYQSETSFSRAFKREFGVSPAAWRKQASSPAE